MIERDDRVQKLFTKEEHNESLLKQKQAKSEKELIENHLITTKAQLTKSLAKLTLNERVETEVASRECTEKKNDHVDSTRRPNRRARRI